MNKSFSKCRQTFNMYSTWLYQVWGKCYAYQNCEHHRWYQCCIWCGRWSPCRYHGRCLRPVSSQRCYWEPWENYVKHASLPTYKSVFWSAFSSTLLPQKEGEYIKGVLQRHNYPNWALRRLKRKNNYEHITTNKESINLMVPYTKGLSESFKNTYSKHGIQVHFKEGNTIKNFLVTPKDKDTITQKMEWSIGLSVIG